MSEESTAPDLVEVVTGLYEAADRGDWDAAISPYAPARDGLIIRGEEYLNHTEALRAVGLEE